MERHAPVNLDTGEISEEHYVRSKKQDEGYRKYLNGRSEEFFMNVTHEMRKTAEQLTPAQSGYLIMLASYIDFDGIITCRKEPASTADMMRLLRLEKKRSTFYDFLSVCMDNGYIAEKDGEYIVNRSIHFRGKAGNVRYVRAYSVRLRALYEEVGAHNLGILYRMIPFIHYSANILCENPNERKPSKIRKLNQKQIAEAVGVDSVTIRRACSRMTFRGKSVFAKITTATDGTFFMINPQIFRRKDFEYSAEVRATFGIDD